MDIICVVRGASIYRTPKSINDEGKQNGSYKQAWSSIHWVRLIGHTESTRVTYFFLINTFVSFCLSKAKHTITKTKDAKSALEQFYKIQLQNIMIAALHNASPLKLKGLDSGFRCNVQKKVTSAFSTSETV